MGATCLLCLIFMPICIILRPGGDQIFFFKYSMIQKALEMKDRSLSLSWFYVCFKTTIYVQFSSLHISEALNSIYSACRQKSYHYVSTMSQGRGRDHTSASPQLLITQEHCETWHTWVFQFAPGAAGILTTSKLNPLQWPPMRVMRLSLMWINSFRITPD